MWTLDEAVKLIRNLQPKAHKLGYHLALAGGVLNNGTSDKDLDILAVPMHLKMEKIEKSDIIRLFELELNLEARDPDIRYEHAEAAIDELVVLQGMIPITPPGSKIIGMQSKRIDLFIYE